MKGKTIVYGIGRRAPMSTASGRLAARVVTLVACSAGLGPAGAAACDDLQRTIEARIRAHGASGFTVTAVDAAASAPGQVVGTCEQGRKKLLYVRAGAASAAPTPAAPSSPAVITECADGRVLTEGGTCKP